MKLITRFELASRSINELKGLYRKIFNELVQSKSDSNERRSCLASLENIQAEINGKRLVCPPCRSSLMRDSVHLR